MIVYKSKDFRIDKEANAAYLEVEKSDSPIETFAFVVETSVFSGKNRIHINIDFNDVEIVGIEFLSLNIFPSDVKCIRKSSTLFEFQTLLVEKIKHSKHTVLTDSYLDDYALNIEDFPFSVEFLFYKYKNECVWLSSVRLVKNHDY